MFRRRDIPLPKEEIRSAGDVLMQYRATNSDRLDGENGPTVFRALDGRYGVVSDTGDLLVQPNVSSKEEALAAYKTSQEA